MNNMPPLKSVTIAITRPAEQCQEWIHILNEHHIHTVMYPCFTLIPVPQAETCFKSLPPVAHWTDIIFTSQSAVTFFFDFLKSRNLSLNLNMSVYSIGPATTQVIRRILPHITVKEPSLHTSEGILSTFPMLLSSKVIIIPGASKRHLLLEEELSLRQAKVFIFSLYQNMPPVDMQPLTTACDYILFTSSSAVINFKNMNPSSENLKVLAIGHVTEGTAKSLGFKHVFTAKKPSIDSIIHLIQTLNLA